PSPVDSLKAIPVNSNSVRFEIQDSVTRQCGQYAYLLTIKDSKGFSVTSQSSTAKRLTMSGLNNGETYSGLVTVLERGTNSFSTPVSSSKFQTASSDSPCSDIKNMNLAAKSGSDEISLSWNAPTANTGYNISGYLISYDGGILGPESVESTNNSFNIVGLQTCTKYKIAVTGFSRIAAQTLFCDITPEIFVKTNPPSPRPVLSVTATSPDSTQISVNIVPDETDRGCGTVQFSFKLYKGTQKIDEKRVYGTKCIFTSGIDANTNYTVEIQTLAMESNVMSVTKTVTVTSGAPKSDLPKAPSRVRVIETSVNALRLSWTLPSSPVDGFVILYSSTRSSSFLRLTVPTVKTIWITELNPCTEYSIKVQSFQQLSGTEYLSNNADSNLTHSTLRQIPPTPNSVALLQTDENDLKIVITHQEPFKCGKVQLLTELYEIILKKKVKIMTTLLDIENNTTTTELIVKNKIVPGYRYEARVAQVDIVTGARGLVTTSLKLLSATSKTPPSAPTGFKVNSINETSVTVSWDPSITPVSGFIIQYTDSTQYTKRLNVSATTTQVKIDNLFPCFSYTANVVALSQDTRSVPSAPSEEAKFKIPSSPTNVKSVWIEKESSSAVNLYFIAKTPTCPSTYVTTLITDDVHGPAKKSLIV
ncbi:hypothetical protein Ciccas_010532, partial [Cichlidogyrus casuarinus]